MKRKSQRFTPNSVKQSSPKVLSSPPPKIRHQDRGIYRGRGDT